jgi:iron complex transport system ATP-binding protein
VAVKLSVVNASFGYNGKAVIKDLSIDVCSGEIICILGPNGVGKTTLFKTMLGFLQPIKGAINLDEKSIALWSRKELACQLGYVPQAHIPPFPFSVIDVVLMGRTARIGSLSSPSCVDIKESEKALQILGICHLKDRIYTELSGGERQMVLIARALTQNPDLLLMDEPTANLDFGNEVRVLERINELASDGLGIVMTSHSPDHAFLCAARVILLCKDMSIITGSAEQVVTEENLEKAYGVRVRIQEVPGKKCEQYIKTCVPLLSI